MVLLLAAKYHASKFDMSKRSRVFNKIDVIIVDLMPKVKSYNNI